jgi:predicted PurR-regulated permease PerM
VSTTTDPAATSGRFASVRAPWPRGLVVLLGFAAGVVAVAGLKAFADVLAWVLLALMITIVAAPLNARLGRRMPSWLATTITMVVVYAVLIALVAYLIVAVAQLGGLIPEYSDQLNALVANVQDQLAQWGVSQDQVDQATSGINSGSVTSWVSGVLTGLLGIVGNLFFLVTVLFFMLAESAGFPRRMAAAARIRPDLVTALGAFVVGTRQYLLVSTIFGAIVAVLDTVALYWLSIPLPVLWGVLAFLTNYIPNVGFVIGVIPPAILGLLEGGLPGLLAVIAVYSVINVVLQTFIQPRFVGDSVGLSTTVTFLALVFWAWVLGPLGALLAIPMTLLSKALLVDIDPTTEWVRPFLRAHAPKDDDVAGDRAPSDDQASAGDPAESVLDEASQES